MSGLRSEDCCTEQYILGMKISCCIDVKVYFENFRVCVCIQVRLYLPFPTTHSGQPVLLPLTTQPRKLLE